MNPDSDKIRDLKIRILLYTDRISQAIDEYKKLDILEQSEKESILKHICLYVLYETVRTAEEDVPIEAAKVLGELQRKEVVPALIELLEKDDKEKKMHPQDLKNAVAEEGGKRTSSDSSPDIAGTGISAGSPSSDHGKHQPQIPSKNRQQHVRALRCGLRDTIRPV